MDTHLAPTHPKPANPSKTHEEWEIAEAWTKFVFPFLFQMREPFANVGVARAHTEIWVESAFRPRELENMLPYVKQYLQLPTNHRRFEVSAECLSSDAVFQFEDGSPDLSFRLSAAALHLFFNGVGCLALEVHPLGNTIQDIEMVNSRLASLANGAPFSLADSNPALSGSFSIAKMCQDQGQTTMHQLVQTLVDGWTQSGVFSSLTPMVDRFLPVYGAVLLEPTEPTAIEELDERFFEFTQHHLTILRKTFTPNDISSFSEIHLEDAAHHYMPYHNVIHTQSLDGGYVLAYDNGLPHFARDPAPAMESFRTSYFFMMLIPFHQRLSILRYAMEAADAGLSPERGAELRRLREEIYDFTSRCYFSQASVSEERNRIYDRWQEEFHVARMYNELKEEVHDIDNYLADLERERENELRNQSMRRDSRNMQLFGLITLVFLPVSVLLYAIPAIPILSRWISFQSHPMRSFAILLGMAAFVAFLLGLMFRFLKRARRIPGQ